MIKEAIIKIVDKQDLTYDEAYAVMNEVMSGETSPTQNAMTSPSSVSAITLRQSGMVSLTAARE